MESALLGLAAAIALGGVVAPPDPVGRTARAVRTRAGRREPPDAHRLVLKPGGGDRNSMSRMAARRRIELTRTGG